MSRLAGFTLVAIAAGALPCAAQVRASERALIRQTVDGTELEVDYARPRTRGRAALFGGQVHWGEVWTPGANAATTLRVSRDVIVNGHELAAGRYSVWLIVREEGDWTVLFDTDTTRFHTQRPEPDSVPLRFDVTPLEGPVRPTHERTIAAADASRYEGSYRMERMWQGADRDPVAFTVEYHAADSTLRAQTPMGDTIQHLLLLPAAEGVFIPAFMENGEHMNTADTMFIEFTLENGRAVAFEARDRTADELIWRGRRQPE
jgi:hypothetical protein